MLPRIGISANFFHPDPERALYKGKTLMFAEESLVNWIGSGPAMPCLIPRGMGFNDMKTIVSQLDGVVFSGGSDISPQSYGELAIQDEWRGDSARDEYEIDLFEQAIDANKPILGICRGMQLINVASGGSLYQDTLTQKPGASQHRDWSVYDQLKHSVCIKPDSTLANLFPAIPEALVNSVHHQAINRLANGFTVQATSLDDGVIEAIEMDDKDRFVFAVQWHPEWRRDPRMLDSRVILDFFVEAVKRKDDK